MLLPRNVAQLRSSSARARSDDSSVSGRVVLNVNGESTLPSAILRQLVGQWVPATNTTISLSSNNDVPLLSIYSPPFEAFAFAFWGSPTILKPFNNKVVVAIFSFCLPGLVCLCRHVDAVCSDAVGEHNLAKLCQN